MTNPPKARTPNEGAWCICGGVFGLTSGLCVRCGRRRAPENTWRDPEPTETLSKAEKAAYDDGSWLGPEDHS